VIAFLRFGDWVGCKETIASLSLSLSLSLSYTESTDGMVKKGENIYIYI